MAIPKKLTALFLRELDRRGIPAPKALDDGSFLVQVKDGTCTVSLENLAKEFARDRDAEQVSRFVDAILTTLQPLPPWREAKAGIRFVAEPSNHDVGDTIYDRMTDSLCRVLAHVDAEESRITWLTSRLLDEWSRSRAAVAKVAADNMAALLRDTPIEIETIEEFRLGIFVTDSPLKASLLFSPNLKEVLAPKLSWPVYAVIPCRDFAYVFPETDRDLIPRLGRVVVREYTQSAYPISTEMFRVSDAGLEAIGQFPVES
jgi:hypothetical protein